jgi:serine/threonine protein kinase
LGDALAPDWDGRRETYEPRDLENERVRAGGRLPLLQCVQIMLNLARALEFLHAHELVHRDIKPRNILFVKGQPKLADVGLVAAIRPRGEVRTQIGTPAYMPPELPGTPQADIYSLGMVLYVISTGFEPDRFPDVATAMLEGKDRMNFLRLNSVILAACQPDCAQRYQSASEMSAALEEVQRAIIHDGPTQRL